MSLVFDFESTAGPARQAAAVDFVLRSAEDAIGLLYLVGAVTGLLSNYQPCV